MWFNPPPYPPFGGQNPFEQEDVPVLEPEQEYDVAPTKETRWRKEQLLKADYDDLHATLLASDRRVDLHRAITLAEKAGPELAFRILH